MQWFEKCKCGQFKNTSDHNCIYTNKDLMIKHLEEKLKAGNVPEAGASAERISSVVRLLPCPFCGGHANLIIEMGEHYIKCMMCYATTGWKDNEESAIKAWNTRQ